MYLHKCTFSICAHAQNICADAQNKITLTRRRDADFCGDAPATTKMLELSRTRHEKSFAVLYLIYHIYHTINHTKFSYFLRTLSYSRTRHEVP